MRGPVACCWPCVAVAAVLLLVRLQFCGKHPRGALAGPVQHFIATAVVMVTYEEWRKQLQVLLRPFLNQILLYSLRLSVVH